MKFPDFSRCVLRKFQSTHIVLVGCPERMKGWWRINHFIATIQAGVIIVWPDGFMYDQFRKQFTLYTCYTKGFHSWMWKGLSFLLPFLYIGYIFQLYNAYTLYNLSKDEKCVEWQVFVSAVIFFILFLGNTFTTSRVIHQKLTEKIVKTLIPTEEKELVNRKLK
ncbi:ion channel TACAN-like isoform X3 [Stegodyphus dumicola]|uniref:ion channel TACAN-like isoform X3 n=1 Tax=Stegodyphus dumicola TaxID=202533 RepID=UPI0015A9C9A7|nr:ion channel TACAN-like isoform X3 [Stegodyphus dumicola]